MFELSEELREEIRTMFGQSIVEVNTDQFVEYLFSTEGQDGHSGDLFRLAQGVIDNMTPSTTADGTSDRAAEIERRLRARYDANVIAYAVRDALPPGYEVDEFRTQLFDRLSNMARNRQGPAL